jgi:plastocyanin
MNSMRIALRSAALAAVVLAATGFGGRATPPATTVDVQMAGDASGYRFAPAKISIKRGDQVRFTLVSGPPHNVVFWTDSVPKGAVPALGKNMPKVIGPLTGPFFMNAGQTYLVSFAGVPAGTYRYYCGPHLALGMTGVIEVR